jgi:signal transduction histidine kinase
VALGIIGVIGMTLLVSRPIRQLASAAGEVAQGNLDVSLPEMSSDEVGRLSQSFNSMTAALKGARTKTEQQASELRQQAQTLQQRNQTIERKNTELEETLHQLHATQEQLLQRERTAALGDLVAGIAHELNNPIGALLSATDVSERLVARIRGGEDTRTKVDAVGLMEDSLGIIKTAGKRVATIVNSLKNFTRLDEAEYQQVDIHEGIESSLTLLGQEVTQRVTIVREYGDLPKLLCNPGQLNQVFLNLIKNAVQALENGGTITVSSALERKSAVVRISDTGRGISPERLKRIFDFGFSTTGDRIKMGSGLAAAFKIVQDHKGEITVDSTPGQGSTFTVSLPLT